MVTFFVSQSVIMINAKKILLFVLEAIIFVRFSHVKSGDFKELRDERPLRNIRDDA